MGVEGSVADVAQQVPVVLRRLPAVEAPLALLAQPSGTDDGGDPDVCPGVVVVLAASGAVEQVLVLLHFELLNFAELPRLAIVVVIGGLVS